MASLGNSVAKIGYLEVVNHSFDLHCVECRGVPVANVHTIDHHINMPLSLEGETQVPAFREFRLWYEAYLIQKRQFLIENTLA